MMTTPCSAASFAERLGRSARESARPDRNSRGPRSGRNSANGTTPGSKSRARPGARPLRCAPDISPDSRADRRRNSSESARHWLYSVALFRFHIPIITLLAPASKGMLNQVLPTEEVESPARRKPTNNRANDSRCLKNSCLWDSKKVSVCAAGSVLERGDRQRVIGDIVELQAT